MMGQGESPTRLPDGYYGFGRLSWALPAIALLSALALFGVSVLVAVLAISMATSLWNLVFGLGFLTLSTIVLCTQAAQFTPIRLTTGYLQCYLFLVIPIRVDWATIWQIRRLPGGQRWVLASSLTPFHSMGPMGLVNPRFRYLQLTPGLDRREEIVREIIRRASIAQGHDVPMVG